mgnify:CR=1 FL=1
MRSNDDEYCGSLCSRREAEWFSFLLACALISFPAIIDWEDAPSNLWPWWVAAAVVWLCCPHIDEISFCFVSTTETVSYCITEIPSALNRSIRRTYTRQSLLSSVTPEPTYNTLEESPQPSIV